jgi:hypothetical protein
MSSVARIIHKKLRPPDKAARFSPTAYEPSLRLVALAIEQPEPRMNVTQASHSVADILQDHVTLELECIDRLYLNVFQPKLQLASKVYRYLREQHGAGAVSSKYFQGMTNAFVRSVEAFAAANKLPLITFTKDERKENVAVDYRTKSDGKEGVLFIGKAQEKVKTFRTHGRRDPVTGASYPWLLDTTALVNQYYFYAIDEDFGPFFLKFSSYFPFTARLCLNGHEYVKRQLTKEGIAFEALDNGIRSCANPQRMQEIAKELTEAKIDALLRKWLAKLPHPFSPADRKAGYRYEVSILQVELSLTQVLDRPLAGRMFFEEVIRDNLDLGRPDNVQLLFARRVLRTTPGKFRTRVITAGVLPSLYIDYKSSRLKQYLKEGLALRTETIINNPRDFRLGRLLVNLSALRKLGLAANRRLLDVQKASQDCLIGEKVFREVTSPCQVGSQRASALPYGNVVTLALMQLLLLFRLLPCGFRSKELREHYARLVGKDPQLCTQGQMTYQLRRLRLHGLIERQAKTHRYRVTDNGLRLALFFTRSYNQVIRPGLGDISSPWPTQTRLQQAVNTIDQEIARLSEKLDSKTIRKAA